MALRPQRFGRYLLIDKLGTGGMAEVFLAKAGGVQGFEKILAIKRVLASVVEDSEFQTMFVDEAQISANLNHVNIGQIFEFGELNGDYFLALEYVPGQDLRSVRQHLARRNESMPVSIALHVIARVCQALDYAHRHKDGEGRAMKIVHRDVSPPNVIVSYEGEVKLIDFGIAKAASRLTRTRAGKLKGKFAYMSPEQIEGREVDHRSDIFSCGVVLYEMLTNQRPFDGPTHIETLKQVRNTAPVAPSTINPEVPIGIDQVVMKALAKDRDERYGWASELRADVERFFARTGHAVEREDVARWIREVFAEAYAEHRELMQRIVRLKVEDFHDQARATPGRERSARHGSPAQSASAEDPASSDVVEGDERVADPVEAFPDGPALSPRGTPGTDQGSALEQRVPTEPSCGVASALYGALTQPGERDGPLARPAQAMGAAPGVAEVDRSEDEPTDVEDLRHRAGADEDAATGSAAFGEQAGPLVMGPHDPKSGDRLAALPTLGQQALTRDEATDEQEAPPASMDQEEADEDPGAPTRIDSAPPGLLQPLMQDEHEYQVGDLIEDATSAPRFAVTDGHPALVADARNAVIGEVLDVEPRSAVSLLAHQHTAALAPETAPEGARTKAPRKGWTVTRMIERVLEAAVQLSSTQVIALVALGTLLLVGVVVLVVIAVGGSHAVTPPAPTGTLVIVTDPPAACTVSVDDEPKRLLSPGRLLRIPQLAVGEHTVQLVCAGFVRHTQRATIRQAQLTYVEARLQKE